MTRQRQSVLIIGGGIAGLTAASHLARRDMDVLLLEKDAFLGGNAINYTCKATEQCEKCDACTVEKMLKDVSQDPRITVFLGSELESVQANGGFEVTVRSRPLFDSPEEQAVLAKAYSRCPVPGALRRGSSKNNWPLYAINPDRLEELAARKEECFPHDTIDLEQQSSTHSLQADAILVASGFSPFDPTLKPTYNFANQQNLVTALDMELTKKSHGRYLRPSDQTQPGRLAFIQCVGSRNEDLGNLWCSQVCCPYALRMAESVKHESPEAEVTVFYMDIQNIGKDSPAFYSKCRENLRFVRNMPVDIYTAEDGGLVVSYLDETETKITHEPFDLVVLSVGISPNRDNPELSRILNLPLNGDGFFAAGHNGSAPHGVFAAGTATGPKSIAGSMAQAGQAVHDVLKYLGERK